MIPSNDGALAGEGLDTFLHLSVWVVALALAVLIAMALPFVASFLRGAVRAVRTRIRTSRR